MTLKQQIISKVIYLPGFIVAGGLALFVSCSLPNTPQQVVFDAKASYTGAGKTFLVYGNLPRCATVPVQPCSNQAIIDVVKKADNVAFTALAVAEDTVRTPGFGESAIKDAATSATNAVKAFVTITSDLGVK